mmetsp:Transcript_39379/g.84030  ORF Transcript_39379/g.84030 Transcript_39379/m.84030 type:complete len:254 (+) Transcript_39379:200-961(+)
MCDDRATLLPLRSNASLAPASESPSDAPPTSPSLPEYIARNGRNVSIIGLAASYLILAVMSSRSAIPPEATSQVQQIQHQQEQEREMLQRAQTENQPMLFKAHDGQWGYNLGVPDDGRPVFNAEELRAPAWTAAAGAAGVGAEPDEPEAAAAAAAPDPNLEDDNDQAAAGTETAGPPPDVVLPPPDVVLSANDKQKAHLREKRLKFKLGTDVVPKEGYSQKEYLHEKRMKWKAEQKRLAKLEKAKIKKAAGGA